MRTVLPGLFMLLSLGGIGGCEPDADRSEMVVPTPQMPAGQEVVADFLASPADLRAFSSQMNAELLGVRNTSFEVEGSTSEHNRPGALPGWAVHVR